MRFKVTEIGTYFGSKEVEAETKEEARSKFFDSPCTSDEYEYQADQFEVEEIKEDAETTPSGEL